MTEESGWPRYLQGMERMITRLGRLLAGLVLLLPVGGSSLWAGGSGPQRVISTAPSLTEIVFALGADDRLVGVTSYCDYPPQAKQKPIIGDFASPSVEAILGQKPDLILLLSGRQDLERKLAPFSLPTLVLDHESLEDIFESIATLGRVLDRNDRADALLADLRERLARVQAAGGEGPAPKVLFLVGRDPGSLSDLYAVGSQGYLGQLIHLAGGQSLFGTLLAAYPKVTLEEVLVRNPDVIVDLSHNDRPSAADTGPVRALWSRFPMIEAVKRGAVYAVDSNIFLIPGPRVVDAVEMLAALIHGDPAQ